MRPAGVGQWSRPPGWPSPARIAAADWPSACGPTCRRPPIRPGPGPARPRWAALAALHGALDGYPARLPWLSPALDQVTEGLAALEAGHVLGPARLAALRIRHAEIRAGLDRMDGPPVVLHGDAHGGNLLAGPDGWLWIDLEETCHGPLAWDLAVLASAPAQRRRRARSRWTLTPRQRPPGAGPARWPGSPGPATWRPRCGRWAWRTSTRPATGRSPVPGWPGSCARARLTGPAGRRPPRAAPVSVAARRRNWSARRSARTWCTTLRPGIPVTPPPPCVAEPAWYRPGHRACAGRHSRPRDGRGTAGPG